jgi:outer membrane protein TolC
LCEAQYQLAKQSLDQVKKAHQKGFSSNQDVLEAQTALAKATHQLVNRVLDENLAQLKLLYQLGLLTPETLLKGDVKL